MKNPKIKVMHLIGSMGDGGAQRIVLNYLYDFKSDPDIELKLYVFSHPTNSYCDRKIKENTLNVVYCNAPSSKIKIPYIKRLFNLKKEKKEWEKVIKEFNPDIVHIHISGLLTRTLQPIINANIPIKFDTLHSNPLRYKGKKLKVIRRAFQKEKFIPICVTEEQAQMAKKYYGFERYEIIHNGIDIEAIKEKMILKKEARELYNIPNNAYVIIGVGRLEKIKNFELLIDAFSIISKKNRNALLVIAGSGSELSNLQKKVNGLKLDSKVRFIGNQDNIVPLYCAADMLGITSISESSSLVLLEAQVCGLRCVISDGVPKESIITDNVQKMSKNATVEEWATELQNTKYKGKAICNLESYEVHSQSKKLKEIYIKYWEENKENDK